METTLRAFIAIDLSPGVRLWLKQAQTALGSQISPGSIRWTNPDGIHATLKFLGEISVRQVEAIRAVLDRQARGIHPFPLVIEGLGCFPSISRPRVLWAGIRPAPLLLDIQKRLEDDLDKIGFPREKRAFSPHLTLGRVKDGVPGDRLADIGHAVENASLGSSVSMEAAECCLFKSVLRPAGAEYSVLHKTVFIG
jgi:2'-5' RNA ligase